MATDPRIALATNANIGDTFRNALFNVQGAENLQRSRDEAPLRNRLLTAQTGQAEAGQQQQEQSNRFQSVAFGDAEILPDLRSGNLSGVSQKLEARRSRLAQEGRDTTETDNAINLLNTDPQRLLAKTNEVIQVGQQQGILKAPSSSQRNKFIGTPSRVERDGQSFLSGIIQKPDGSFGLQEVPVDGEFTSILGETAAQQEARIIREAGGKTTATLEAEQELKPGVEAAVTTAVGAAEAETPAGRQQIEINKQKQVIDKRKADLAAKETKLKQTEAVASANDTVDLIDKLIAHPGRLAATGTSAVTFTRPGSRAADFEADFNRLKGSAFLEAVQKLKGSGQISNTEGEAATASILGVELGQSEEGFVESLKSLKARIIDSKKRRGGTFEVEAEEAADFDLEFDPTTGTFK